MLEKFSEYVKKYDFNERNIKYKYGHSIRVMNIAKEIAIKMKLNDHLVELATIAGLFHDIGRFRQWKLYHTFKDDESNDHGFLGLQILLDNHLLTKLVNDKKEIRYINDAIRFHNQYSVRKDLPYYSLLLCKIVRDADKIDILNSYANGINVFSNINEAPSLNVQNRFKSRFLIRNIDLKNSSDNVILLLAFAFDLYYPYTINYLKKNKVFERIETNINSDILKPYFNIVYDLLK